MAIQMSSANVDTAMDRRSYFNKSNVDIDSMGERLTNNTASGSLYGAMAMVAGLNVPGSLAGVTADFASAFQTVADSYKAEVQQQIDQLCNPEVNQAFRGAGVQSALEDFVVGIRDAASAYLDSLTEVEKAIVNAVRAAYVKQDNDLAGNVRSDTSRVSDFRPNA